MYSYEARKKAVNLYIKYGHSAAAVVHELGYPNRKMIKYWYLEYEKNGELHESFIKHPNYSIEQKNRAVEHYLEHGRCIARTCKMLGYPSRPILREWVDELAPGRRKASNSGGVAIQYTQEQKKDAVIGLCVRKGSADAVAATHGTSRTSLYKWKKGLLGEEESRIVKRPDTSSLPDDKAALLAELSSLDEQIYRKQMELDILNKAAEILKKDQGIDQTNLTNREKSNLIDALRMTYPLNSLLEMMNMPKSSYFYQKGAKNRGDKYSDLRKELKAVFIENNSRYGYRRIHAVIRSDGQIVSEKVIRRIMREESLVVPRKRKRKYSSYLGEISPAAENIVARDVHSEQPNVKWLTDLTEFHIPAGKVYLSPIIDCFDGLAVSWTIGTSPNAELVNDMLDDAISTLSDDEKPVVHSDRGCHYRWPGWISRMDKAGLTRSMSKKGCSPDNSACEGFFGSVKNEMFYYRSWDGISIDQFIDELDSYLVWYNGKRIKMSLGAMSPLAYRRSIGLCKKLTRECTNSSN